MTSRRKTRELAFIALYQLEVGRHELEPLIQDTIVREGIDADARPYFRSLVRAVWKEHPLLDALIDLAAAGWRAERLGKVELSILRLTAAELTQEILGERGEAAVVISEAVILAKRYAGEESARFINGILGKVAGMESPLDLAQAALDAPRETIPRKALPKELPKRGQSSTNQSQE